MGALNNHYCDACAIEMRIVNYRVKLVEVGLAPDAITVDAELCGSCYSRLYAWLQARKEESLVKWTLTPVEDAPIVDGELDAPVDETPKV